MSPAEVLRATQADLLFLQEAAAFDGLAAALVWHPAHPRRWGSAGLAAAGRLEPLPVPGFEGLGGGGALGRCRAPKRHRRQRPRRMVPAVTSAACTESLDAVAGLAPARATVRVSSAATSTSASAGAITAAATPDDANAKCSRGCANSSASSIAGTRCIPGCNPPRRCAGPAIPAFPTTAMACSFPLLDRAAAQLRRSQQPMLACAQRTQPGDRDLSLNRSAGGGRR